METIIISAATIGELSPLVTSFRARRHRGNVPWDFFVSRADSARIIFAVTGVGIANAASATTASIHLFSPQLVINTGCAGAYGGTGLAIGDLVVATSEVFADTGIASHKGLLTLEGTGIPLFDAPGKRYFNEIPLSSSAADMAFAHAARFGRPLAGGRFLTVSACSGTGKRGDELRRRFGGVCENMEGAAVALVTARYGVDCLEVRGVSNRVEDRDLSSWDIPLAAANACNFIESLIREA